MLQLVRVKTSAAGFTLIELVIVIVIAGILVTVALNTGSRVTEQARVEEARVEMDALARAIVGDPSLGNLGGRTDFGYVGDIGALPPDLEALRTNPGGWAAWRGPYIRSEYDQDVDGYKIDPWGGPYAYSGIAITSNGSGSPLIRSLATSTDQLLQNSVAGTITDLNGTPPGDPNKNDLAVRMTVPDGTGGITVRTAVPDAGGYFEFGNVPIGVHDLRLIYSLSADTIARFATVTPGSSVYAAYKLDSAYWSESGAPGVLTFVPGSDSLLPDCHGFVFHVENTGGSVVTVNSVTVSWSAPIAYYRYIRWNGLDVFDEANPKAGSGDESSFTSSQTISPGQSVRVECDFFKSSPTGGADVGVNGVTFSILFSDGSGFDITTGGCP